jgi:hypothetical protein
MTPEGTRAFSIDMVVGWIILILCLRKRRNETDATFLFCVEPAHSHTNEKTRTQKVSFALVLFLRQSIAPLRIFWEKDPPPRSSCVTRHSPILFGNDKTPPAVRLHHTSFHSKCQVPYLLRNIRHWTAQPQHPSIPYYSFHQRCTW